MAISRQKLVTLHVLAQEGDFQIACMDELSVKAGEDVGFTLDVVPLLGFNAPVKFSVSGGPVGMTVSWPVGDTWTPGGGNIQCNLAVPLNNALVGDYPVMVDAVSQ